MRCPDVNVLVYAFREDSADHHAYRDWLQKAMTDQEPIGISELVLSAVVRIVTNHRVFNQPSTIREALDFCGAVRSAPAAVPLRPGPRHWAIFERLCEEAKAKGNAVPDAYHAALAVEHGATWITTDRGFARFPTLDWRTPFE